MIRLFILSSFFLTFASGSFVLADEKDYAGQEKIIPDTQTALAPYTATFTIPKDPSITYALAFGDGTPEGRLVCAGSATCSVVKVSHLYQKPGTYAVELFRLYEDDAGKISKQSLRGLAARAFVDVKEVHPKVPSPSCKRWFDGCVECTRSVKGGALVCPKKQCFGALLPRECKEEFYVNKVPVVTITGPASTTEGIPREWTVSAKDFEKEKMVYAVRWGDESPEQRKQKIKTTSAKTFTHTFGEPGVYTITAFARDSAGGVGTKQMNVTVRDAFAGVTCTREYVPVCAEKNGVIQTYSNECSMNKARAKKKHAGAC